MIELLRCNPTEFYRWCRIYLKKTRQVIDFYDEEENKKYKVNNIEAYDTALTTIRKYEIFRASLTKNELYILDKYIMTGVPSPYNKNVAFLKECIADALLDLAKEKPVEKITVDEITSKAGVGRASYFRYFNSKEEIITFKMDALWKSWSKEHEILNQEKYTMEKGIIFYRLNYSIKDILRLIYSIGMKSVIFNAFNDVIVNPYSNDDYKFYNKQFFSSGLFGILDAWIRNDFKESPELIAEYTNRILYE